jgi:hypothetical protein
MVEHQALQTSLLEWAGQDKWNWFLALPIPDYPGPEMGELNFWPWIRAVERHDGTSAFRFMRFTRIGVMPPVNERDAFFVLVGGLGSGEWRYWSLQWAARNTDPELRGRRLWSARQARPLGPVLKKVCGKGQFFIEMHHGPRRLGYDQYLKVDDKGIPYDPKLRKTLKRGLSAAERRALQPPKGIVVMPHGTRWRSLLD